MRRSVDRPALIQLLSHLNSDDCREKVLTAASEQSRAGMPDEGLGIAILIRLAPRLTADVTKPARRLWPANAADRARAAPLRP
jgi:hypothetical protein